MRNYFKRLPTLILSMCLLSMCTACNINATDLSDLGAKFGDSFEKVFGTSEESRYANEESSVKEGNENNISLEPTEKPFVPIPDETLAEFANLSYTAKKGEIYNEFEVKEPLEVDNVRFKCLVFESDDSIVYAFRGTPEYEAEDNIPLNWLVPNWAESFVPTNESYTDWKQTLSYYLPPDNSNNSVHAQYEALRNAIIDKVIPLIKETDKNVYITGHSLGGWLSLEAFMIANERLGTMYANKIKVVATFNTIGVSKTHGERIRDHFRSCDTTVKNFYICCDIARWYGREQGFDFPGNNFIIDRVGHDELGIAKYNAVGFGHATDIYSVELIEELNKVATELRSQWKRYLYSIYFVATPGVFVKDNIVNFAKMGQLAQNAFKELDTRIDAHKHFCGLLEYSVLEDE